MASVLPLLRYSSLSVSPTGFILVYLCFLVIGSAARLGWLRRRHRSKSPITVPLYNVSLISEGICNEIFPRVPAPVPHIREPRDGSTVPPLLAMSLFILSSSPEPRSVR